MQRRHHGRSTTVCPPLGSSTLPPLRIVELPWCSPIAASRIPSAVPSSELNRRRGQRALRLPARLPFLFTFACSPFLRRTLSSRDRAALFDLLLLFCSSTGSSVMFEAPYTDSVAPFFLHRPPNESRPGTAKPNFHAKSMIRSSDIL